MCVREVKRDFKEEEKYEECDRQSYDNLFGTRNDVDWHDRVVYCDHMHV